MPDPVIVDVVGPRKPPRVGPYQADLIEVLSRAVAITLAFIPVTVAQRPAPQSPPAQTS